MKILTIGASPYLLVRNAKINADIIEKFVSEGHEVSSAVWHHDEGYFMPSEEGVHSYEKDGKHVCYLYPFTPKTEEASPFIYELMKRIQPDLVVTIGDYKDTNFVYAIKSMYPTLFRWVAVYTFDSCGISVASKDSFEYADAIVSTSEFGLKEISSFANVRATFIPYGPDSRDFVFDPTSTRDRVLCSARNAQSSNLAAFIRASSGLDSYIHTNLYDPGDYNLDILKERYKADKLSYTEDYCSIKEGVSLSKMNEIYNNSSVIVDCSIKSATGLSLLEGMRCGCVPVGPNYGRVGEIISKMPEGLRFFVPYCIFVGQNEEEFAIISSEALNQTLINLLHNKDKLKEASVAARNLSNQFSKQSFLEGFSNVVQEALLSKPVLALDSV